MSINFIENNPEKILMETIAYYEESLGHKIATADVDRLLIHVLSYREGIMRGKINQIMSGNFLETAQGTSLDLWGQLYNLSRNVSETDDSFKKRIKAIVNTASVGTKEAIKNKVLSVENITDVQIVSKHDDETLVAGTVYIYPIEKGTLNEVPYGVTATATKKTAILTALNDNSFGLVGDNYQIKNIYPARLTSIIDVDIKSGLTINSTIRSKVLKTINTYFGSLSFTFSPNYSDNDLKEKIEAMDEVLRVVSINSNVPILRTGGVYWGDVTLNLR